jgi:hypothetical protein
MNLLKFQILFIKSRLIVIFIFFTFHCNNNKCKKTFSSKKTFLKIEYVNNNKVDSILFFCNNILYLKHNVEKNELLPFEEINNLSIVEEKPKVLIYKKTKEKIFVKVEFNLTSFAIWELNVKDEIKIENFRSSLAENTTMFEISTKSVKGEFEISNKDTSYFYSINL